MSKTCTEPCPERSRSIRVLVADDHAVLRAGLRLLLNAEPDMEVVGEAADGAEAVAQAVALKPDVVLMDITMPGMSGLEATRRIKAARPEAKVLALTMHDDQGYLRSLLEAGGSGYVLKKSADEELLSAIRIVHQGGVYLHPSHTRILLEDMLQRGEPGLLPTEDGYERLSPREREVLRLVALGYTNQQIADQLYVSIKTVETYRARVMKKLGLRGRAALVRYALRKGLLTEAK
ncbi:MAG: response regulator [Anaerolineae bacterium]